MLGTESLQTVHHAVHLCFITWPTSNQQTVQDAAPQCQLASFSHLLCPCHVRHCSTSSQQDPAGHPPRHGTPPSSDPAKQHCVILSGGPRTMIREDVLDIFARHSMPVPPDCVTPFYQRKPGEGFSQQGWAVRLPSHSQVSSALRISYDKVVRPPSVPNPHQPAMPATRSPAFLSAAQSCFLTRIGLATAPSTFDGSIYNAAR